MNIRTIDVMSMNININIRTIAVMSMNINHNWAVREVLTDDFILQV